MNNRHTDNRKFLLIDSAFWGMVLAYLAVVALVYVVAWGTSALLGWLY